MFNLRISKIAPFLKIRENQLLVLLMAFTIIIKVYYFIKLGNQPIWWDEGDYLSIAKVWALRMDTPEWWGDFTGIRPFLLPIIWCLFMKLGLGETVIRFFTLLVPSILTVYLTYAVGKDLYNKKIGLISGFLMSVYWVHQFYTYRLLTDIFSIFLGMLTVYCFWSLYVLKQEKKGLYLAVLFGVLTFTARFPHFIMLFTCFLFLLFTERSNFFKKKINWKALGLIFLLVLPYIIYFISNNFYVLKFYFNPEAVNWTRSYPQAAGIVLGFFPFLLGPGLSLFKNVFLIFLFIGLFSFYRFLIAFDMFWKQSTNKLNADFFVILWIVVQLFFYIIVRRNANDRWLLMLMPALFFVIAKGFYSVGVYFKGYLKYLTTFLIILLIFFGGYYQLKHANNLIELKRDTYKEVKLAGLWLKENTSEDAKIITTTIVQNQYYSERQSYVFDFNKTLFDKKISEIKPDYLVLSIFHQSFTPDWAYSYPQEQGLTPIKYYLANKKDSILYGVPEGQPLLIIYKF